MRKKLNTPTEHSTECLVTGFAIVHTKIVNDNALKDSLLKSGVALRLGVQMNGHEVFTQVGKNTLLFFCVVEHRLSKQWKTHKHFQVNSRQVAEAYLETHESKSLSTFCANIWFYFAQAGQVT